MATILAVDDIRTNRRLLTSVLKAGGHSASEAPDGAAALAMLPSVQPDLIITDILMPVMDGFEFARRVKADPRFAATPIMFYTTTFRGPEARAMAALCGVRSILPKPCTARELLAAVNKELGRDEILGDEALPSLEAVWEEVGRIEQAFGRYRQELGEMRVLSQNFFAQAAPAPELESLRAMHDRFFTDYANLQQFSLGLVKLLETSLNCSPERGTEHVAGRFFDAACRVMKCSYAALCLGDRSNRQVLVSGLDPALYRDGSPHQSGVITMLEQPRGQDPLHLNQHSVESLGLPPTHPPVKDFLGMQVSCRDQTYGWIYFADKQNGKPFTDEDVCTLTATAAEFGMFHESALMYDLLQRHVTQLQIEIVRRQEAEAQKRESESHLAQLQKMETIGQLTGGVAHDFNNLLTVIQANTEDLRSEDDVPPARAQQIDLILKAVERGAALVRQLLAFSRKQELKPQVIRASDLFTSTARMMHRVLPENITLDVINTATDAWLNVDPASLENAVLNLVLNARDAMPQGGTVSIEVEATALEAARADDGARIEAGSYLHISVKDSGVGMSTEILAKAFEPFFTTKDVGIGTGLGLSMVYGFVKQSGGHAKLESVPGQGTTVHLYLPRVTAAVPDAAVETSPQPEALPARRGSVLLAEDDELVRLSAESKLWKLGYNVTAVATAREALAALEQNPAYDLLFTDIIMPGDLTGADLVHEVRKRWPGIRILATSGYTESTLLGKVEIPRGVLLLRKPYSTAALTEALANATT